MSSLKADFTVHHRNGYLFQLVVMETVGADDVERQLLHVEGFVGHVCR